MSTLINPVLGNQILVQIGDGATPEVFAAPALINTTRGISFSTNTQTDELIDIDDQAAPAVTTRRVTSTDLKVDGAGMVHAADSLEYLQWSQSGEIKNVKISDGNWTITGPFVLTAFQISGDRLKASTCQITLEQAGAVTVAAAA